MGAHSRNGFTIVELLIVIVVIAILATITIVAYNGITGNAKVATIEADLEGFAKTMETAKVRSASARYPDSQGAANLKTSNGVSVTNYYVNNTASPATFCITATHGDLTYRVDSSSSGAVEGSCLITNYVPNPSVNTASTGWTTSGDFDAGARVQVGGQWVFRATRTGTGGAVLQASYGSPITTVPGATYTASATVTSSVNNAVTLRIRRGGATATLVTSATFNLIANEPQRISMTTTIPEASIYVAAFSTSGTTGSTLSMDDVMLTDGSQLYSYADGGFYNWSWSGTANNSSSSGPML